AGDDVALDVVDAELEDLSHLRHQAALDAGADALAGVRVLDCIVPPTLAAVVDDADGLSAGIGGHVAAVLAAMAVVERDQLAAELALEQLRHQQDRGRWPAWPHAAQRRQPADQVE